MLASKPNLCFDIIFSSKIYPSLVDPEGEVHVVAARVQNGGRDGVGAFQRRNTIYNIHFSTKSSTLFLRSIIPEVKDAELAHLRAEDVVLKQKKRKSYFCLKMQKNVAFSLTLSPSA